MNKENVEVSTKPAILEIPDNAVRITVTADIVFDDLSLHKAEMVMNHAELIDCFIDGEEWKRDNVKYYLTDTGKDLLKGDG